ncbi:MAG: hypothetical protein GTO02_02880 [Candidatus Dadabacteria bacterium]|nr:hypothetical protein [Candidatus Dadabacteria bacterium]
MGKIKQTMIDEEDNYEPEVAPTFCSMCNGHQVIYVSQDSNDTLCTDCGHESEL